MKQKISTIWLSEDGKIPEKSVLKKLEHIALCCQYAALNNRDMPATEIEFITNIDDLTEETRKKLKDYSKDFGISIKRPNEVFKHNSAFSAQQQEKIPQLIQAAITAYQEGDQARHCLAMASDILRFSSLENTQKDTAFLYIDINDEDMPNLYRDIVEYAEKLQNNNTPMLFLTFPERAPGLSRKIQLHIRSDVLMALKTELHTPKLDDVIASLAKHLRKAETEKRYQKLLRSRNHNVSQDVIEYAHTNAFLTGQILDEVKVDEADRVMCIANDQTIALNFCEGSDKKPKSPECLIYTERDKAAGSTWMTRYEQGLMKQIPFHPQATRRERPATALSRQLSIGHPTPDSTMLHRPSLGLNI